ncbi:LysM peptidoglycan-binding domain-containing protein, partial [Candidatus Omnitrophota bacterium]
EPTFVEYEVQNGDTLQKISKKFYGTYRKWNKIYQANIETLTDPNRIKPGMTILVPEE